VNDQAHALETLDKLKAAAPPVAAARIAQVSALLQQMAAENADLAARLRLAEAQSVARPEAEAVTRIPLTARALAADVGLDLPDDQPPDPDGLAAVLNVLGAPLPVPAPESSDRLGTSVLAGSDQVEGGMPGPETILPRYRILLRPLLQSLYDETGFGTRARTRVDELLALLDALDRLNTVRRGLIVVHPIVFNPAELLRQSKRNLSARATAKDQQLVVDSESELPPVLADGDLCQEVLDTIIGNAIRYTDYGGEIRVTAESLGTDVLFTISDTGIGIEPGDLDKIATPFFRAHQQPMVLNQPGAGLRLFIARQLLDIQGGEMFFSGEPGLGASFSFTLPAAGR
jgi:signal transduction histidine kinase